jgi:hypothetical protein
MANITMKNILSKIQLGTYTEFIINLLTLGKGELLALFIAKKFFNSDSCGCCERKQWLNRLTNPHYDGKCNQINLL